MTDKASFGTGWALQFTSEVYGGNPPSLTTYYAAIEDPQDAIDAVRAYTGAGDEALVEVRDLLTAAVIAVLNEKFGLQEGGVIPWVKI
jgi:hypothetical protein